MNTEKFKQFVVSHKKLSITVGFIATGFIAYKIGTHHPNFWLFKKGGFQVGVGDENLMLTMYNRKTGVGVWLTPDQARQVAESINEGLDLLNSEI